MLVHFFFSKGYLSRYTVNNFERLLWDDDKCVPINKLFYPSIVVKIIVFLRVKWGFIVNFYSENPTYFRVFYNHLWNLTEKKL